LAPGETKTVEMRLPAVSLAYWDTAKHAFVVEGGKVELRVGASSADERLKTTVDVE
jgi:beta-glucosidase